jgi:RHS repeat-associated protein
MMMPGRKYQAGSVYRYGFNGKENDKDAGEGVQDYGMRIYDTRLVRFLSVDPLFKSFPWYTPYQFAGNTPIQAIDLDGEEEKHYTLTLNKNGSATLTNLPSKTKEYNEIPLWLRIITLGAGKSKYKIQPRAVVTYGSNTYKIGFAGSPGNENGMEAFNKIVQNPNSIDPDEFTSTFLNEDQSSSVAGFTWAVNMQNNTAMYGPLTSKAWYSHNNSPGSRKRLEAFLKFGPSWSKGSASQALNKFTPGVGGVLSGDGVKTNYLNTKTNIEVMVDNENNYFRIYDHNKKQYIGLDGKIPSTGSLKGQVAKDYVQSNTHFVNTDK